MVCVRSSSGGAASVVDSCINRAHQQRHQSVFVDQRCDASNHFVSRVVSDPGVCGRGCGAVRREGRTVEDAGAAWVRLIGAASRGSREDEGYRRGRDAARGGENHPCRGVNARV